MELKKVLKELEFSKFNENKENEPIALNEVADNGSIKLYEIKNNGYINDTIIRKYIPELFPDFKFDPIDLNKCYLLGDENGLYFGQ